MVDRVPDQPVGEPTDGTDGTDGPRLPSSLGSNPSVVLPPARGVSSEVDDVPHGFKPLRTDPPPLLMPTWWLRYALFGLLLGALVATLTAEYAGEGGDLLASVPVVATHVGAAACLVMWSALSMHNAQRIVPASRYQSTSRGWLIAMMWIVAFAAPAMFAIAYERLFSGFNDPDDDVAVVAFVPAVFITFVLVWLPFRYCARHAARIGAPHVTMTAWFWVTLITIVGALGVNALGLDDMLAEDGRSALDRVIVVGVVYGLPMFVFALASWRATTVFDEVIDLRWRRWKKEWEQTLQDFSAQPAPGAEPSPAIPPSEH